MLDFQIYWLKTSGDKFISRIIFLILKVIDTLLLPQKNTVSQQGKTQLHPNQAKEWRQKVFVNTINYGEQSSQSNKTL